MFDQWHPRPTTLGCAALALGMLAACSGSTSASPTPGPATAAPASALAASPTAAADVLFTGCGAETFVEPPPQFTSSSPGAAVTPQVVNVPVAEAEALALVHQSTKNTPLAHLNVSCHAKQYPASLVAGFITGKPVLSSAVWVVAVKFQPNGASGAPSPTDDPAAPPGSSGLVQYEVYFVSNDHPVRIYGATEYPGGIPLPSAFTSLG